MRPTEDQDQAEKQKAEQIVAQTPLMDGVDHITVELADDHDGEPSMWLIFYLNAGFEPELTWYERFVPYSDGLTLKVLDSGLTRFPYTRLRPAA